MINPPYPYYRQSQKKGRLDMINQKIQRYTLVSILTLTTAFASLALAGKDFIKKDLSGRATEDVQLVGE